jgi:outer membrane protein TolC
MTAQKLKIQSTYLCLLGCLIFGVAQSQTLKYTTIPLKDYLEIVKENNALIESGKLDVQSASANKTAQSLYRFSPSVMYVRGSWYPQVPYSPYVVPQSDTYSLTFTLEGWGKRSAREQLAQSQISASNTQLETTKTTIQTSALNAYIDTLRLALIVDSYQNAINKLNNIKANPKLADSQAFLKYYQSATSKELMFSALSLRNYSGNAIQGVPYPKGTLNYPIQKLNPDELIEQAQKNRMDVIALQSAIDVADKNVTLTNKNRNIDILPYIAQTRTPQYNEAGATYTAQNSVSAGVTIPIPVNNYLQNADIVQASNQKLQYEIQLRDLKEQIWVQVLQAYLQYEAAVDALNAAQTAYDAAIKKPNPDTIQAVMDARDKEGALLDAKTNYLKALVYLWRQSGNYAVPTL